jgi:hypothetical protein
MNEALNFSVWDCYRASCEVFKYLPGLSYRASRLIDPVKLRVDRANVASGQPITEANYFIFRQGPVPQVGPRLCAVAQFQYVGMQLLSSLDDNPTR